MVGEGSATNLDVAQGIINILKTNEVGRGSRKGESDRLGAVGCLTCSEVWQSWLRAYSDFNNEVIGILGER